MIGPDWLPTSMIAADVASPRLLGVRAKSRDFGRSEWILNRKYRFCRPRGLTGVVSKGSKLEARRGKHFIKTAITRLEGMDMVDLNTRRHPRVPLEMPVKYEIRKSETELSPPMSGVITDVSEGGMAIRSESFLARGTRLHLELDRFPPSDDLDDILREPFELEAHVQRCMMVSAQPRYLIAINFDNPPTEFIKTVRKYVKEHASPVEA